MTLPQSSLTVSPEQVADLQKRLSVMRHNVNNHLALIVAACELIRRKPELALRLIENIQQQPERITSEIRSFSDAAESVVGKPVSSSPH